MNSVAKSVTSLLLRASLLAPALALSHLLTPESKAVSIPLDGTRTLVSGTDCGLATYRFGTTATYNGIDLDLLVEVTDEDNEYANGQCVGLTSNLLSLRVNDEDADDDVGSMDLTITVVAAGTTTPVAVDRLTVTGFDLDINGGGGTSTDDIYLKAPDGTYLSRNTQVRYTEGSFFGGEYQVRLGGATFGNCDDTATTTTEECRAGAVFITGPDGINAVSSVSVRVQNDNAYGQNNNPAAHRLFQLSFEIDAINPVVTDSTDYGDAPASYGDAGQSIDANIALGFGLIPDDDLTPKTSADAEGDDTDTAPIAFDDEDGIRLSNGQALNGQTLNKGTVTDLDVTTFGSGFLSGWVDLNNDGSFNGADELLIDDFEIDSSTIATTSVPLLIPLTANVGTSYIRFRYSTNQDEGFTGLSANDGEVEDYQIDIQAPPPPTGSNVCNADYDLVYSGQNNSIFAVHVESGASLALTTTALATANGLSTDHVNRQVYYGDGNTLYAWSPLTGNHVVVDNNFSSYVSRPLPPGFSISSGGAGFYGGSVYQGSDIASGDIFEIFKVDFSAGSNGLGIESITPIGIDTLVQNGTLTGSPNWGDFIIDNNGVIIANGNGNQGYWSYDLNTATFTDLDENFGTNSQLAKDGRGRLWALGANDIFQVEVVGNALNEIPGTRNPTTGPLGAHSSFDAAECVRGASSIGDRVWQDTNGNGTQDAGEGGFENVTVDLIWDLNGDGAIDANEPVLATRSTDANGNYDFDELIFGNYIVRVTDTNGVLSDSTLTTSAEQLAVNLPVGTIDFDEADFGYEPPSDPDLLLTKRISAINRGQANQQVFDSSYINVGTNSDSDNAANWPGPAVTADAGGGTVESYIAGITNGTISSAPTGPGDMVEYTISFLSSGDTGARRTIICDPVPANTTFVEDAFNSSPPASPGAGNRGILLSFDGANVALTNANDGDEIADSDGRDNGIGGYYFPIGTDPTATLTGLNPNCTGPNTNGLVVVDMSNVPNATGDGAPADSYGFVRFWVTVD